MDNVRQDSQLNHLAITPTEINMGMNIRGHGGNVRGRAFASAKAYAFTSFPGLLALPGLLAYQFSEIPYRLDTLRGIVHRLQRRVVR